MKVKIDKNIVVFDKPYSQVKINEGLAVDWAVVTGACDKCAFLPKCENSENFKFPNDAACMVYARTKAGDDE